MTIAHVNSVAQLRAALRDSSISTILVAPGDYLVNNFDTADAQTNGFRVGRDVTIKVDSSDPAAKANFKAGAEFGKGIFYVAEGVSVTFDGIGFYDTKNNNGPYASSNTAGIRHEGANLTILNCYFANNRNGILATSRDEMRGDIYISNTHFYNNGTSSSQEHSLYLLAKTVIIENCTFRNATNSDVSGHHIKTMVDVATIVRNNYIYDNNATSNHPINVTGGGNLIVEGNYIQKDARSDNSNIIFYSASNDGGVNGAIRISGNTFVSNYNYSVTSQVVGPTLLSNYSDAPAIVENNILSGAFSTNNLFLGLVTAIGNQLNNAPLAMVDFRSIASQGTSGNDVYVNPSAVQTYLGYNPMQSYNGLAGDDMLFGNFRVFNSDALFGGAGNDIISGQDGSDFLYGEDGDDIIFSGSSSSGIYDYLSGGAGNDRLYGYTASPWKAATVYMDGGDGNDLLDARYSSRLEAVGGTGDDIILGGIEGDVFSGGDGSDILYGGPGTDFVSGGLVEDNGNDVAVYKGAYGTDLSVKFQYQHYLTVYTLGTALGNNEVPHSELLKNIEYIQFSNGVYDVRARSFVPGAVRVDLNAILSVQPPADPATPAKPFNEAQILRASDQPTVTGTSGNDVIQNRLGQSQIMVGGAGNDKYIFDAYYVSSSSYGQISEQVNGGIDMAIVSGVYAPAYTLPANVEIGISYSIFGTTSKITGNDEDNLLVDMDDNNPYIVESEETAHFDGGAGDDILYGGNKNDTLNGGAGIDTAIYRGARADYSVTHVSGQTYIVKDIANNSYDDGEDRLTEVELLRFADGTLDLRTNQFTPASNSAQEIAYKGGYFSLVSFDMTNRSTATTTKSDAAPIVSATPAPSPAPGAKPILAPDPMLTPSPSPTPVPTPASVPAPTPSLPTNPLAHLGPLVTGTYGLNPAIYGTNKADTLFGSSGNDQFILPIDYVSDTVAGGAGHDVYHAESTDKIVEHAGEGFDTVIARSNFRLPANVEALVLLNQYHASAFGNSASNLLIGDGNNNRFRGGAGDDVIVGGRGSDDIDGESGHDIAVFEGAYADYRISRNGAAVHVTHVSRGKETDKLSSIETLKFSDGSYHVATGVFSANPTTGMTADLRDGQATLATLDVSTVLDFVRGGAFFIRGDQADTVSLNGLLVRKFDADVTLGGVTYKHYFYGNADIYVETGVKLTSPYTSISGLAQDVPSATTTSPTTVTKVTAALPVIAVPADEPEESPVKNSTAFAAVSADTTTSKAVAQLVQAMAMVAPKMSASMGSHSYRSSFGSGPVLAVSNL